MNPTIMNTATMNTKEERCDKRNLMKMLKSNDYVGVKMLMKQKAIDLNFLDSRFHCSPLMLEAGRKKPPSIEMMKCLLDHGANINFRDKLGMTALHLLMLNKTTRSLNAPINFLLSYGANPNAISDKGDSPLHRACSCGNIMAVRCLLTFCNSRDHNKLQNQGMKDSIIQMIDVNCMNDDGNTPLILATSNDMNRGELVKILVKYKAEINLVNRQKCSALHFASMDGSYEVIDLLLHRGADVNFVDDLDYTPLEYACYYLNANAIHSLLTFHADANRQDRHGRTTLHLLGLVDGELCFFKVLKCFVLLLSFGANIDIQTPNGETPLSYTVRRCLFRPCSTHQRNVKMGLIELLLRAKSDADTRRLKPTGKLVKGDTILHYAVRSMKFDMVQLILHYDPDLRVRNCRQETARDVAKKLDPNDANCIKIIELIEKKMEPIRIQYYSYLVQSWVMSDGEQEQLLHHRKRIHVPCPLQPKKISKQFK